MRNLSEISCIELDTAQNSRKAVLEHISKDQQDTILSLTRILGDCLYIHVFWILQLMQNLRYTLKQKSFPQLSWVEAGCSFDYDQLYRVSAPHI